MSDSIVYVLMEVGVHGLDADTPEQVAQDVDKLLRDHYAPELSSDVTVELIESAGTPREP